MPNQSLILLVVMVAFIALMMFTSSRARKRQAAERERMMSEIREGVWVLTIGRMYGRVVDVDGDVVVLASTDGSEFLFDRAAIASVKEPPFAQSPVEGAYDTDAPVPGVDTPMSDPVVDPETPTHALGDDGSEPKGNK